MMPKVLWRRRSTRERGGCCASRSPIQIQTDRIINELMGKDASARFRFIMERAEDAQSLTFEAARTRGSALGLFAALAVTLAAQARAATGVRRSPTRSSCTTS